jgi:hypothetical protein
MSFVLFVLGLIAVAAGVATIGFGIPINEFSLGNTLILAGTTGLASGLVVIALAVTHRQLKKIADLLMTRPGGSSGRSSDVLESPPGGGRLSAQRPPLPVSADMPPPARGPSYPDRPLRNAPTDFADEDDFEAPPAGEPPHLRLPGAAPRNAAPSQDYEQGFDPIEDVPVSPRTQPRIPGIGTPPPAPAAEPKSSQPAWRPPGARPATPPINPDLRSDASRHEPSLGIPERPQRPSPEAAFDSIWPANSRADRIEPQPDFAPEPAPAPRPNGDATHREPMVPREPARPAAAPTPVSILKSGVVDGMAYTLYTDGSIEAELAQGVVRFGSIEELRNHLEKGA